MAETDPNDAVVVSSHESTASIIKIGTGDVRLIIALGVKKGEDLLASDWTPNRAFGICCNSNNVSKNSVV